jgi:sulfur transfer complex TusBCD TusB component (DsrH family)
MTTKNDMAPATTTTTTTTKKKNSTTIKNTNSNERDSYGFELLTRGQPKNWKDILRNEEIERQRSWHEFLRRGENGMTPRKMVNSNDDDNNNNNNNNNDIDDDIENDSLDAVRAVLSLMMKSSSDKDNNSDNINKINNNDKDFDEKRKKELEMLVVNGLPMSQRADLWLIFCDVAAKKKEGLYDDLVRCCFIDDDDNAKDAKDNLETVENRNALFEPNEPILSERNGSPRKFDKTSNNNNSAINDDDDDDDDDNNNIYENDETAAITNNVTTNNNDNDNIQSFKDAKAQVEKDLPRTFPAHSLLDGVGRDALRRVLLAYAKHNPSVGYCQGLNFLAGLLLLLMPEESAFYVLGTIVEEILPGYFVTKQMLAPSVDQKVLRILCEKKFPTLMETLDKFNMPLSAITLNWFLCIFVNRLPWETALRVWDVLLFRRDRTVLFQATLALLESPAILRAVREPSSDVSALAIALQSAVSDAFDASALLMASTIGNQDVTMHKIDQLARKHRKQVAKEIFGSSYAEFMQMSMSFAFVDERFDLKKGANTTVFEQWCTPWRNKQRLEQSTIEKQKKLETPLESNENTLTEKVSKMLTFDCEEKDGEDIYAAAAATPMTCDSVQTTSTERGGEEDDDEGDEESCSASINSKNNNHNNHNNTSNKIGSSFKEWMQTARKSWEGTRGKPPLISAATTTSSTEEEECSSSVTKKNMNSISKDSSEIISRLEKLENEMNEKDAIISKLTNRIEQLEIKIIATTDTTGTIYNK